MCDKNIQSDITEIIGKSDASVTIPNPDIDDLPFPTDDAIPIPRDKTRGTVTGPVVTAPQSHARPINDARYGFCHIYKVRPIVGIMVMYINGFSDQLFKNLSVPMTAAKPTPKPTVNIR